MPVATLGTLDSDRRARLERTLALARMSLAVLALVVLQLEVPASELTTWAAPLTTSYAVYAFGAAVLVGSVPWLKALGLILQFADMLWAVVITAASGAGGLFVFPVFVLVSAAYRWGLWHTLVTGIGLTVLLVVQAVLSPLSLMPVSPLFVAPNQVLIRCAYCIGLSWLIGYVAEDQNRSRMQAAATARVLAAVDLSGGLRRSVESVLRELLATFGAGSGVMIFEEEATGRAYRWSLRNTASTLQIDEVPEPERESWVFPLPARGSSWRLRRHGHRFEVLSDSTAARSAQSHDGMAGLPFRRVLVLTKMDARPEWTGRLLLFDAAARVDRRTLQWVTPLASQLGPVLHSLYLVRRLRSRITAMEQARIARELHDGVIQSLVGLEMQVDVLRREVSAGRSVEASSVLRIQELLHNEVMNVRELMQQIRPVGLSRGDLPRALAELAERFRRDTGISTKFVSVLDDPDVPPRLGRELLRITQEALVNVRKHSGASEVVVRFGDSGPDWTLVIEDNGAGFPFAGQYDLDALDAARRGPVVIKERVRSIRGSLVINSVPGQGTQLAIRVARS